MIDLTRLMFDDGADRKPIGPTRKCLGTFSFEGNEWGAFIVTEEDFTWTPHPSGNPALDDSGEFYGWWFYTHHGASIDSLSEFTANPRKWIDRLGKPGWRGANTRNEFTRRRGDPETYTNGFNVLVRFEVLS